MVACCSPWVRNFVRNTASTRHLYAYSQSHQFTSSRFWPPFKPTSECCCDRRTDSKVTKFTERKSKLTILLQQLSLACSDNSDEPTACQPTAFRWPGAKGSVSRRRPSTRKPTRTRPLHHSSVGKNCPAAPSKWWT